MIRFVAYLLDAAVLAAAFLLARAGWQVLTGSPRRAPPPQRPPAPPRLPPPTDGGRRE
jgi:hypothetical protein